MKLLGSGRTADVYALDEDRVLRRYNSTFNHTSTEVEIMRHVAEHGYPVPLVYEATAQDLVLQRIHGPTMQEVLQGGLMTPEAGGQMLADLHRRLHAIPGSIVHLDLHPGNVMLVAGEPVVIDWSGAREGRPELDVGLSAIILAEVVVSWPDESIRSAAQAMLLSFLDASLPLSQVDIEAAYAWRAKDPAIGPEHAGMLAEAVARLLDASAGGWRLYADPAGHPPAL